jgi:hypothetical protein
MLLGLVDRNSISHIKYVCLPNRIDNVTKRVRFHVKRQMSRFFLNALY